MPVNKILMVLGGEPPDEGILKWRMEETDLSIAVDAGWFAFRHADLSPDVFIGDMDSTGEVDTGKEIFSSVEVIVDKEQNNTDFQKALLYITSKYTPQEIIILGALGKRTDHLISNLFIVSNIDPKIVVIIDSRKEWLRRVTSLTPLNIVGQEGATLSLLPLSSCLGVSASGLKWKLENENLSRDSIFSQSNFCSSNSVNISLQSGNLIVFLQK